jgi:hypothetical protein
MAKATWLPRRTFWLGMATAVVVMTGADRAGAQEPRVATNAIEDAQDNVASILAALGAPSVAPDTAVIVPSTQRTPSSAPPLARWVDVQTGTVATRFRYTEATTGAIVHDQQQLSEQFKARLKIDQPGAYAVNIALGTGNTFVKGWNNTSLGTPSGFTSAVFVKQLFASASPLKGIEIQAGGLGIARGENSEITSYDNDGYMVGERVSIKRPGTLHVDELSITMGYLGDSSTPALWQRFHRLSETNYYQVLAAKKLSTRFSSSADVTTVAGATTIRSGFKLDTPGFRWTDSVRFEQYARFNNAAYGYLISGERVVARRFTLSTGLADIDQYYGALNSDRFGSGRRWFTTDTIALGGDLSAQIFYTHTVSNGYAVQNRQALHVLLTYNVAKGLERLTSR